MIDESVFGERFRLLSPVLGERGRRLLAASEALGRGHGAVAAVVRATGMSRRAVVDGIAEIKAGRALPEGRHRQPGGGRKRHVETQPKLRAALEALVEPETRGDPESPLRWTSKSVRRLAEELKTSGFQVSHTTVAELLAEMDYSLQSNKKAMEGADNPDRDAQFEWIGKRVKTHLRRGEPVISVDAKKKELVGNFKNAGRELRPKGDPVRVRVHDFMIPELGKVTPYGVYDVGKNLGWVNVGVDHDTSAFAVASIRRWWESMGRPLYPKANRILVTADGGGSNGSRVRQWKTELQKLADLTGLRIEVCHLPPGTSKWNKIEHRLFAFISKNWRGKPLISHEVIVNLIAATTTTTGLRVSCELDETSYPKGVRVTDEELLEVALKPGQFRGDWNYTISPKITKMA